MQLFIHLINIEPKLSVICHFQFIYEAYSFVYYIFIFI